MKKRTIRVTLGLVILWVVACNAVFFVFWHGLATKRWPWTGSKEEMRADGERVITALKEFKAVHGHYPKTLHEAGIDPSQPHSYCYYHAYDKDGDVEFRSAVSQATRYSLTVTNGPDDWRFYSGADEWTWDPNVGGGG